VAEDKRRAHRDGASHRTTSRAARVPGWMRWAAGLVVAGVVIAAVVLKITTGSILPPWEDSEAPPAPRVVALGDSYISGEGARAFFAGTDDRRNKCRRAPTAYPYVVAQRLGWRLTFVACSGARTEDILTKPQYANFPENVYGAKPQAQVLKDTKDANVVLLSIGGNDAAFGEIGQGCARPDRPDCRNSAERWVRALDRKVYPALLKNLCSGQGCCAGCRDLRCDIS
jgi:hypothetical protein